MGAPESVFLDFNLPNATTWFYFSGLLAVASFFKFSRLLSVRNWDVLTLFLLVPGLLMLRQAKPELPEATETDRAGVQAPPAGATPKTDEHLLWLGYLWLLGGSGYFLFR